MMEYYSAIKDNEIIPIAAVWADLENITPNEISQIGKDKYCKISLICKIYKIMNYMQNRNKPTDINNKLVVIQGGEGRKQGQRRGMELTDISHYIKNTLATRICWYRELYPFSCDNLNWKIICENTESLCCTPESNILITL